MKRIGIVSLFVAAILSTVSIGADSQQAAVKPNFVFILGEGQGWVSTSVPMDDRREDSKSDFLLTPSFERLAREGMRFSSYYAPSPRCTPSRAAYFTGVSPAQLHMTFVSQRAAPGSKVTEPVPVLEMPLSVTTVAELLKPAGYATAHFGKWHVGRTPPSGHGFDEHDGANSNGGPENVSNPNPKQAYGITERGIDFMTRQVKAGKPFYLQISHYAGRRIDDARPETVEQVLRRGGLRNDRNVGMAAAILDMDITIGTLLDALDQLQIAENTYVIYTADHGTPGRNGPLTGGKGGLWDGGLRIPLFIRGPKVQGGTISHTRVTGVDLYPTLAELAGVGANVPREVEGGSLVPVLTHAGRGDVTRSREELVFHFPHYDKDDDGPSSAILLGDFKLMRVYATGECRLFDLPNDLGEQNNLAGQLPQKVAELDGRLSDYLRSVNAQMPTVNGAGESNPRPDSPRKGGRNRKRGGQGKRPPAGTKAPDP